MQCMWDCCFEYALCVYMYIREKFVPLFTIKSNAIGM